MPDGQVLEFTNVTKHFNEVTAVSDFSARVEPGAVTAFLGPNGAGKTTTLRILLGQVRATSGTATIGGTAFAELRQPLRTIGSVLEDTVYRPRRTANRQLTIAAKANGIQVGRVEEVLSLVGLEGEGDTRIGGYSLGMRQRLSIAHALLGDPGAVVLDEPANGLDPEGIRWMRLLMRRLADEGRTVLVSSHLLSEIEQVADNVLVLSKGKLVLASGIEKLADPKAGSVVVDAADRSALTAALSAAGFEVEVLRSGLTVRGGDAGTVGAVAAAAGIALSALVQRGPTLEDVFIELTRGGKLGSRAESAADRSVAPGALSAVVAADAADAGGAGFGGAGFGGAGFGGVMPGEDQADSAGSGDENVADASGSAVDASDERDAARSSDEGQPEEAQRDDVSQHEAPARSFDEILFGAEVSTAETEGVESEGDASESDASEDPGTSEEETTPTAENDAASDEPPSEDAASDDAASDDAASEHSASDDRAATGQAQESQPAGVEFFAEIGETGASDDAAADVAESTDEDLEHSAPDTDDPRSAAVSSMLADAARAYYEDEPKDYPLNEASSEVGTQWSLASTGVIDTVPDAASEEGVPEGTADHDASDQVPADESHGEQDESQHGEQDESQHGEQHDGEHHAEEHHQG